MPLHPNTIDPILATSLKIGSGFFWTLTYLFIIIRGWKDKRCGMPFIALCTNISWEFIFSFVLPHAPPQLYIDYIWFSFDIFIVFQYLFFGKKDFPLALPGILFYPIFLLTLSLSFGAIIAISFEFEDYKGIYAAFGQNLMMSVLFIYLLFKQNGVKGQSLYIGLCKLTGTAFASILFYSLFPASYLLNFLYISIILFDIAYVLLISLKLRSVKINPWRRL